MSQQLNLDLKRIAGIGESRSKALASLGVTDLATLLAHYPRAYEYRGNVKTLASGLDGEKASFILTMATPGTTSRAKNNITITKFLAYDDTAKCTITFFNKTYVRSTLHVGAVYRVYGKIVKFGKQFEIANPVMELISDPRGVQGGKLLPLFPVYPACKSMSSLQIGVLVGQCISYIEKEGGDSLFPEILPEHIEKKYGFISHFEAVKMIHTPSDFSSLNEAKRRIAYEEIYTFAKRALSGRNKNTEERAPYIPKCDMSRFVDALPYELTNAQKRTVNEIYKDMVGKDKAPMRRMISGDVGSGKTICAAAAAYICICGGYQVALMAPTEVLARQHYNDLSALFSKLGIKTALLIGECGKTDKESICKKTAEGAVQLLIGTHALITERVTFKQLGLVICDEQHRFGVNQRQALVKKGDGANLLVMSATPIPRTLALVMFGDLDVSQIDELPPGRREVSTFVVDETYRTRMYEFIRKEVAAGHQAYIVCPSVDDLDDEEFPIEALKSTECVDEYRREKAKRMAAVSYARQLGQEIFPDIRVAYLHGKMKGIDKERVIGDFEKGKIDVLVSTTVIEVGVNIPNATVMVVENAECFGLSQLHQLRGRVGRGNSKSYCILVSTSDGDGANKRLEVMKNCRNGYKIAEEDLKQRGPGDFFKINDEKIRQHGDIKTSFGTMFDDVELLYAAFADAKADFEAEKTL